MSGEEQLREDRAMVGKSSGLVPVGVGRSRWLAPGLAILLSCGRGVVPAEPVSCDLQDDEPSALTELEPGLWRASTGAHAHECGVYALELHVDTRAPGPIDWTVRHELRICNACPAWVSLDFVGNLTGDEPLRRVKRAPESLARIGLVDQTGNTYVEGCGHPSIHIPQWHPGVFRFMIGPGATISFDREVRVLSSVYHGGIRSIVPYWDSPVDYQRLAGARVYWPKLWPFDAAPRMEHTAYPSGPCNAHGFPDYYGFGVDGYYEDDLDGWLVLPPVVLDEFERRKR